MCWPLMAFTLATKTCSCSVMATARPEHASSELRTGGPEREQPHIKAIVRIGESVFKIFVSSHIWRIALAIEELSALRRGLDYSCAVGKELFGLPFPLQEVF